MRVFDRKDTIIALVIVVSISVLLLLVRHAQNECVLVQVNGETVMIIDKPGRYPVIVNGRRITTVVYDGKRVRVVDSDCPLKICEKMGWIEPGGEIVCVPNKLVVKFGKADVDAMTW